jgi:hypothetical protein
MTKQHHLDPHSNRSLMQFMLRAQQIAQQESRSDRGYAMMMTSIVSILMFSLLGAYLTMSNLSRSTSVATVKSSSTFYAAESGLNARAQLIRQKVGSYAIPTGTTAPSMDSCWNAASNSLYQYEQPTESNDFGCKNYSFLSAAGTANDRVTGGDMSHTMTQVTTADGYIAATYVANNPDNLTTYPRQATIPTGELFAGMKMLEYTHRVYSTARSQTAGTLGTVERTVLQLDFQTRFVPMFQFAAFYNQDLEITPGPNMYINGRVHTNGNLHLTSNATLCLAGQVSAKGNIYNRRKHEGSGSEPTNNGLVYIYPNPGTCVDGMSQNANNRLENKVSYQSAPTNLNAFDAGNYDSTNHTNMVARFGSVNLADRVDNIKVPSPDFLAKTATDGSLSTYYTKADLRIELKSNPATDAIPFNVSSLATGMGDGSTCAGFDVATDRTGKSTLNCIKFGAGQLHSLLQPVLVMTGQATDDNLLCTTELSGVSVPTSTEIFKLSADDKTKVTRALQTAIVSQKNILKYSEIASKKPSNFSDIQTLFSTYLSTAGISSLTPAEVTALATTLNAKKFNEIASIAGNCFKSAPVQKYDTFFNNRERANLTKNSNNGNITMLQTNIESLTIWNRDGLYANLVVDAAGNPQLAAGKYQVQTNGANNGIGNSAYQQVYKFTPTIACGTVDDLNLCKSSFRHLGLAGIEKSEGGLAFYMSVDNNNSPNTSTAYPVTKSPYGFAITGAKQLPGALTVATDQAAYLQGDYNFSAGTGNTGVGTNTLTGTTINPTTSAAWTVAELSNLPILKGGHKLPASILADSVNVTSVSCLNNDKQLNCGQENKKPDGNATTINAAFLGGSDIMAMTSGNNYSGGLHNYPRFHENWKGALNYRGSFVSLGAPLQVSGTWDQTVYSPPTRNWDYDTDFNDVANLPPLTPNMVYLRQRVFTRGYGN